MGSLCSKHSRPVPKPMSNEEQAKKRLFERHSPDEFGFWEIRGEDPNCDFGGPHVQPLLTRVEGEYREAVDLALSLDGFFSWGSGGSITKLEFRKLKLGTAARIVALKEEKSKLEERLEEIKEELGG